LKFYEYVIRRLILLIFVMIAVSLITFYIGRGLLPPESGVAGYITLNTSDPQKLGILKSIGIATSSCPSWSAFVQRQPGCLVPLWQQYFGWIGNIFRGNWGTSLLSGITGMTPTWDAFASRFPYTAQLAIVSGILTVALGIPIGVVSATHNNKLPDHLARMLALVGYSMPTFWFGFILQIVFVLYIVVGGAPLMQGSGALATSCAVCVSAPGSIVAYTGMPLLDSILSRNPAYLWDTLVALILPAVTLSITTLAALTRILRSSMMDALRQDYILLARSKGLKERTVIYRHALRNAMLPAVTISGLIFASLFGGVVITETVFAYPGIGQAVLAASVGDDINFLELYVLVSAVIVVVANLAADLVYALIDPRIRY